MNGTPAHRALSALHHVPPRRGRVRARGRPDLGGTVTADLLDRILTLES